jgi:hypothetical protein
VGGGSQRGREGEAGRLVREEETEDGQWRVGEWRRTAAAAGRAERLRQYGLEEEEEAGGVQRWTEWIKKQQYPLQHEWHCG